MNRRPLLAGACTAAAILTRPNLVLLAMWPALLMVLLSRRDETRPRQAVASAFLSFAAPVFGSVMFLLALNNYWYGSPITTGYGAIGGLFSLANVPVNFMRYVGWLIDSHTPLVLTGCAAPLALSLMPAGGERPRRLVLALVALGFAVHIFASYLPYSPFDDWWYLRFLLPGLPLLLVSTAGVVLAVAGRLPEALRLPAAMGILAIIALHGVVSAREGQAFQLRGLEERYALAGAYAAERLPANAVLLSMQHSGSLHYYAHRPILRYDYLDPAWLDRAVAYLRDGAQTAYLVVEESERNAFLERFSSTSELGRLDWPPLADLGHVNRVRIYDLAVRASDGAGAQQTKTERVLDLTAWRRVANAR